MDKTHFYDIKKPVYANVTAAPELKKEKIKENLYRQLTAPVLWEDTIKNMISDGFTEFVEVGPGKVLQGLVKRIDNSVAISGIDKYSEIEKYL